jgi:hypothetical protein
MKVIRDVRFPRVLVENLNIVSHASISKVVIAKPSLCALTWSQHRSYSVVAVPAAVATRVSSHQLFIIITMPLQVKRHLPKQRDSQGLIISMEASSARAPALQREPTCFCLCGSCLGRLSCPCDCDCNRSALQPSTIAIL